MTFSWSWSRLRDFNKCPRFFHLKYILKALPGEGDSPALIRGTKVHEAMEDRINYAKALPEDLDKMEPVLVALREIGELIAEPDYAVDQQRRPCGGRDWDRATVRAKIDLLIPAESLGIQVDWKTGKPHNADARQLMLGALIIMAHHPELTRIDSCFFFIDPMKKGEIVTLTRETADSWWEHFEERADRIHQTLKRGEWTPNPSRTNCKFCAAGPMQCPFKRR